MKWKRNTMPKKFSFRLKLTIAILRADGLGWQGHKCCVCLCVCVCVVYGRIGDGWMAGNALVKLLCWWWRDDDDAAKVACWAHKIERESILRCYVYPIHLVCLSGEFSSFFLFFCASLFTFVVWASLLASRITCYTSSQLYLVFLVFFVYISRFFFFFCFFFASSFSLRPRRGGDGGLRRQLWFNEWMAFGVLLISYEVFGTMFHTAINVLLCCCVCVCSFRVVSALLADTNVNQHHLYHLCQRGGEKHLLGALCNIILLFR